MRLEFQIHWLRVLIEIARPLPVIRRYRVASTALEAPTGRFLQRRIAAEMRRGGRGVER